MNYCSLLARMMMPLIAAHGRLNRDTAKQDVTAAVDKVYGN